MRYASDVLADLELVCDQISKMETFEESQEERDLTLKRNLLNRELAACLDVAQLADFNAINHRGRIYSLPAGHFCGCSAGDDVAELTSVPSDVVPSPFEPVAMAGLLLACRELIQRSPA